MPKLQQLTSNKVIKIMERNSLGAAELLIDELSAREAAKRRGVPIIGFPGILIRACQQGIMSPDDVKSALDECRKQGTHYSSKLIDEIFNRLLRP